MIPSIKGTLRECRDLEYQYLSHRPNSPKSVYTPWMPFQIGEFLSIMAEVVMESHGDDFLDVGCGPGTKLELAKKVFDLRVKGIEVDRRMAEVASVKHRVHNQDALGFTGYGDFHIVWLYRPFRDPHFEYELEQKIMADMQPGAILAGGSWEMEQPPQWIPVVDDWEARRGAWMKPGKLG